MAEAIEIAGRGVVKGRAEGEALVADAALSFWGEVDAVTGEVIAVGHPLEGQCLAGRVLVIRSTKGSSGTPMMLKLARPDLKVIATEPAGAALLSGKEWQPHKIQGWTPDFIPAVLDREIADELVLVSDEESIATSRDLAAREGIFTGISGGGTVAAALKVAAGAEAGSVILAMLPDTGERYLSTPLMADIDESSDDDWLASL